jgi:hypothetical protein
MLTELLRRRPAVYDSLRRALWSRPHLYSLCSPLRNHHSIKNTNYDICLEGFPRSANTYLKFVLLELSASTLRLQSHLHCPPAVHTALAAGKPVILTVRSPAAAIVSRSIYNQNSVEDGLFRYISFHELLLPVLDHPGVIVASFDAITHRLPQLISRLNQAFALGLPAVSDPAALRAAAFARIEAQSRERYGRIEETIVHRPSPTREKLAPAWQSQLAHPRLQPLARRAEALYETFAARSC